MYRLSGAQSKFLCSTHILLHAIFTLTISNSVPFAFCTSFRPHLPVEVVQEVLAFSNRESCLEFLTKFAMSLSADKSKLDCKLSMSALAAL